MVRIGISGIRKIAAAEEKFREAPRQGAEQMLSGLAEMRAALAKRRRDAEQDMERGGKLTKHRLRR